MAEKKKAVNKQIGFYHLGVKTSDQKETFLSKKVKTSDQTDSFLS